MKSLLKLALIFSVIIFGFTACIETPGRQGAQGPPGPPGPPGEDGWAYYDVKYYEIKQWALAANGRYFFSEVNAPAITTNVLYNGVIFGYLVYNYDTNKERHIPLPYDIYYNTTDQYGNITSWTETVSFEITPGKITFYYEPSDFYTGDIPQACMFKIVAMW
jgi:hypothetical protein